MGEPLAGLPHSTAMHRILRIIVHDYGWIHLSIGLAGNLTFLLGSVFFLPGYEGISVSVYGNVMSLKTSGVWLFIIGAAMMSVGSIGRLLVSLYGNAGKNS